MAFLPPYQPHAMLELEAIPSSAIDGPMTSVQAAPDTTGSASSLEQLLDAAVKIEHGEDLGLALVTPPPSPDRCGSAATSSSVETTPSSAGAFGVSAEAVRPFFFEPRPQKIEKKSKAHSKSKKSAKAPRPSSSRKVPTAAPSSRIPTRSDPRDEAFSFDLFAPLDSADAEEIEEGINPVHRLICAEILEGRRTKSGRVYFQCRCCEHLPVEERVKFSTMAPQSVESVYRSVNRWSMSHFRECPHIPAEMKARTPMQAKAVNKSGGAKVKDLWRKQIASLGLEDAEGGGAIVCRAV